MESKFWNIVGIIAVIGTIVCARYLPREKIVNAGIKLENLDTTVSIGDNFYDYATLGWRRANPIPDDYSRYGAFDVLRNTNLERTREIAENDSGKIGRLYSVAMDAEKLNTDGVSPLKPYLEEIDNLSRADLE